MYKVFLKEINRVNWYCCEAYQQIDYPGLFHPGEGRDLSFTEMTSTPHIGLPSLCSGPPHQHHHLRTLQNDWLVHVVSHTTLPQTNLQHFMAKTKKCKNRKVTTGSNCATLCHATLKPWCDGLLQTQERDPLGSHPLQDWGIFFRV